MNHKVLLINGPNLNLLGRREPSVYGHQTLADIVAILSEQAQAAGVELEHIQSNAEFELINALPIPAWPCVMRYLGWIFLFMKCTYLMSMPANLSATTPICPIRPLG